MSEMSEAVICDECGRILKSSDALHCYEAVTKDGRTVYGADICKDCLPQFDKKMDINGWNLSYKKDLKVGAKRKSKSTSRIVAIGQLVKSLEVLTTFWYLKCRAIAEEGANVQQVKDRIIDAHRREIADEKRISDAVIKSLRDKKLEIVKALSREVVK